MYRRELNDRSPMRVFEKSMHGGLGSGNVGVVAAGPGVGKTALLVQIALDDLLRQRRVLHISHEQAVDHVRAYYNEIFHDLSVVAELADAEGIKLDVERNRLIFSLMSPAVDSERTHGASRLPLTRVQEAVSFSIKTAQFEPDVIIIDGFDFQGAGDEPLRQLGALARECNAELWLSVRIERPPRSAVELPAPLEGCAALVDVVVYLDPEGDRVRLRLLKDHENTDLAELQLCLDPPTMRIIDEDVLPAPKRPRNPRRCRLVSGGAQGAEAYFGSCAERWGMKEVHYSFAGHRALERRRGVLVLSAQELRKGEFSLLYASRRLNRALSEIPQVRSVLQTIWHQINDAREVFAVGVLQDDGTLRGGTGWGAELARLWNKPLHVYDQTKRSWLRWSGSAWEIIREPEITRESFAGIGTQKLSQAGRTAIEELFRRSFGEPPAR